MEKFMMENGTKTEEKEKENSSHSTTLLSMKVYEKMMLIMAKEFSLLTYNTIQEKPPYKVIFFKEKFMGRELLTILEEITIKEDFKVTSFLEQALYRQLQDISFQELLTEIVSLKEGLNILIKQFIMGNLRIFLLMVTG